MDHWHISLASEHRGTEAKLKGTVHLIVKVETEAN